MDMDLIQRQNDIISDAQIVLVDLYGLQRIYDIMREVDPPWTAQFQPQALAREARIAELKALIRDCNAVIAEQMQQHCEP